MLSVLGEGHPVGTRLSLCYIYATPMFISSYSVNSIHSSAVKRWNEICPFCGGVRG